MYSIQPSSRKRLKRRSRSPRVLRAPIYRVGPPCPLYLCRLPEAVHKLQRCTRKKRNENGRVKGRKEEWERTERRVGGGNDGGVAGIRKKRTAEWNSRSPPRRFLVERSIPTKMHRIARGASLFCHSHREIRERVPLCGDTVRDCISGSRKPAERVSVSRACNGSVEISCLHFPLIIETEYLMQSVKYFISINLSATQILDQEVQLYYRNQSAELKFNYKWIKIITSFLKIFVDVNRNLKTIFTLIEIYILTKIKSDHRPK